MTSGDKDEMTVSKDGQRVPVTILTGFLGSGETVIPKCIWNEEQCDRVYGGRERLWDWRCVPGLAGPCECGQAVMSCRKDNDAEPHPERWFAQNEICGDRE